MDARSWAYVTAVSLLTCMAFGLFPALGISKVRLSEALSEGRGSSQAPRYHRWRVGLVVLDIALAFVLLVGAGLMANSFTRVLRTDLQVNTRNVLFAHVLLMQRSNSRYSESPYACIAFSRQIMEAIARLPGVQAVAVANGTPADGDASPRGLMVGEDRVDTRWAEVSPDYFRLLQIPIIKGRHFTERDDEGALPVAMISESLARRLGPNQDVLGRHLTCDGSEPRTWEIIGVVKDVRHLGDFPDTEVYVPYLQVGGLGGPRVLVRTDGRTTDFLAAIRREITTLDPDVTIRELSSLEQKILDRFSTGQMTALLLLGSFSMVAVLLAGVGVYGTIAYTVSCRTHEIGIRMALGARDSDVVRAVLRQGLRFTVIGLALGLAGALALVRIIRSLLYEVSPTDPLTFTCVTALLTGVAVLACYLPARWAARIDPMAALRQE